LLSFGVVLYDIFDPFDSFVLDRLTRLLDSASLSIVRFWYAICIS
jgi:hypothetical protein